MGSTAIIRTFKPCLNAGIPTYAPVPRYDISLPSFLYCAPAEAPAQAPNDTSDAIQATVTRPMARPITETPEERGTRLAMEAFPHQYCLSSHKLKTTIRKRLSAHVRQPRASNSMRWRFKLDLVPMLGVKKLCEAAGLEEQLSSAPSSSRKAKRIWRTSGASATAKFASLEDSSHALAWGGAKLKAPAKGSKSPACRLMTLVAPPITVTHVSTKDEDSAIFEGHLVTYNEQGILTIPPKHETLWGDATEATKRVLTKYAKRMLGDMFVNGMPISQTFKQKLGPQYASSESEYESEGEWEEETEEEAEEGA